MCVLGGLASAESTEDYFRQAFQGAMPAPFGRALEKQTDAQKYGLDTKKSDPNTLDLNSLEPNVLRILPPQALVMPSGQCAIPLLEIPIAKDRQFTMQRLPAGQSSQADPMTVPAGRVCGR